MHTLLLQLVNLPYQTVRPSTENCLEQVSTKIVPREIENSAYAKFCRENRVFWYFVKKRPLIKSACEYNSNKL